MNSFAFAGPQDEAARNAVKRHLSSPGTTPAITDSVHLHLCSFHDMIFMALSTSGRSAVNSSTFAHSSSATASSLSHGMRKRPLSSSGPAQKMQGSGGITVRMIFSRHRHMTCMGGDGRLLPAARPGV